MEEAQQLLGRWSTLVQLSSLTMVAAFFWMLGRANPRAELRWWARAWTANFVSVLVVFTSIYWLEPSETLFPLFAAIYVAGKGGFTLMLAQGAWTMTRNGRLFTTRNLVIGLAAYALAVAILLRDITTIAIVQHALMGAVLLVLSIVLITSGADGVTWLAGGVALRGFLAMTEAGAYVLLSESPDTGALAALAASADTFLSASSSFAMIAEWLMVLGSVLAVSERSRHALEASHDRLVMAQDDLRRLADRDPLTGAINRRALRDIFRAVEPTGAMLLFFDLDGFKKINDEHGHAAGDRCLKVFAGALKESFRPSDHVIRYGGDEFLVVAPGLDHTAARTRVEDVTARLQMRRHTSDVLCGFSVGMSELAPGGVPEAALQQADDNMYKAKNREL